MAGKVQTAAGPSGQMRRGRERGADGAADAKEKEEGQAFL